MPLRILHLFADWKWTGPAEPTVNLCLALRARGHDVTFACSRGPRHVLQTIAGKARERGLEPRLDFDLRRRFRPLAILRDLRAIEHFVRTRAIQVVHVHLSHDHVVGGIAARRAPTRPLLVRTNHKGVPLEPHRANDFLFRRLTDGYVGLSREAARTDAEFAGFAPGQVWTVEGAVDLDRFRDRGNAGEARARFGFLPEHVVLGIVARMQRHRRFDVLLEAVRKATDVFPALRVLIVGRGTHRRAVAREPVRRLGLEDRVVFAGYRSGDYVDALGAIDVKVFLVPGSDGSCRAVREAMAMGKPVIAARRGMLPEIVADGETGRVVDDTPENLAEAIVGLCRDPALRRRMGLAARAAAERRFSLAAQAETIERAYLTLLDRRPPLRTWGWLGI